MVDNALSLFLFMHMYKLQSKLLAHMLGEQMLPIWVHETCPNPLYMVKCLGKQHGFKLILIHIFVKVLSSITKKGEIESSSLVLVNWWNPFGLTLCSKCEIEIGWSKPSDGAIEVHGDGVGHVMMIKLWTSKRRKRKIKWAQGKGICDRAILFWWSRHVVTVITFRIDSRTIKRGETHCEMRLSKCH